VLGDQATDEDEVVVADVAVSVAQAWLVHAPHGNDDARGTQAR